MISPCNLVQEHLSVFTQTQGRLHPKGEIRCQYAVVPFFLFYTYDYQTQIYPSAELSVAQAVLRLVSRHFAPSVLLTASQIQGLSSTAALRCLILSSSSEMSKWGRRQTEPKAKSEKKFKSLFFPISELNYLLILRENWMGSEQN